MKFLLQIRGTKHTIQHRLDEESAETSLQQYFRDMAVPFEATRTGEWFVDVAVEFASTQGMCLQWRTDQHARVIKNVLAIPERHAKRITSMGSSEYERDVVAHMPEVSGCRITTGALSKGPHSVRYAQLYTTDKSLTYSPEAGRYGKYMSVQNAMEKTQPPKFIVELRTLYVRAIENNASHCRVELRVPISNATTVLLDFSSSLLQVSLLAFPKMVWW
jgi:hypothetical protein